LVGVAAKVASSRSIGTLQQKLSIAKKGSRARKLLVHKVARLHQKIARQRKQFHYETAQKVLKKANVVFVEDLSVKSMSRRAKPKQDETFQFHPNGQSAKSGLNKSIADAGWSQFIDILTFKAEKAGQKVVKVNPKGTSQHCSNCLNRVPKELSKRWHSCLDCGTELDRDTNAAILIKKVGLDIGLLKNAQLAFARKRSPRCLSGQRREYVTICLLVLEHSVRTVRDGSRIRQHRWNSSSSDRTSSHPHPAPQLQAHPFVSCT
jgi:putative transposase